MPNLQVLTNLKSPELKLQTCVDRSIRLCGTCIVPPNLSASLALFAWVVSTHFHSDSERLYAGIDIAQVGKVDGLMTRWCWMQFMDLKTNFRCPTGGDLVVLLS